MNKFSSLLLHLYLHLLHFLIMNKSSYFKKKKNQFFLNLSKKKKKGNFQKGPGTRGIGLILLRPLSKINKKIHQSNFFQIPSKIQDFQIFQKKKNLKFSIPSKNSSFPNSKKKKKIFIKFFFRNRKL